MFLATAGIMEQRVMKNGRLAVAALALMACCSSAANARTIPLKPIEASIETAADLLVVPSSNAGTLVVRGCPEEACALRSLAVDGRSRFIANGDEVTPAKFAAVLSAAGKKPVTVHYRLSDSKVTRVVIMARNSK